MDESHEIVSAYWRAATDGESTQINVPTRDRTQNSQDPASSITHTISKAEILLPLGTSRKGEMIP